ncbi:MAG: sugar phosphate nucleotidyltransferase [Candidatus Thermoplasmatota archaeon]|jgi:UTP--glucose-1-phosphate uridylyltransferase|nr:sugar phosphate nucleotidyltransferase [Candidatus Thermoplasmatota archaeon]MCL5785462.1 sugar phosphate nucleotidyltransferase [Candidatus Thermoplasmatota archaeon]
MPKVRKAVIPAAGIGSRFYPLTRAQPKEMLPIVDKPVIHYVVEEAVKSGLDEIVIVVGAGKDAIINYFDRHFLDDSMDESYFSEMPDIYFVRQRKQIGLANAVLTAEAFVGEDPFTVLLGDTIYESGTDKTVTSQILEAYDRYDKPTIAVEKVTREKMRDYGMVEGDPVGPGTWAIRNLLEKPEPSETKSDLGITGIYVLEPDIFNSIRSTKPGRNGEYQLTDALLDQVRKRDVYATSFNGTRHDIGTKELWIKTFMEYVSRDKRFASSFDSK